MPYITKSSVKRTIFFLVIYIYEKEPPYSETSLKRTQFDSPLAHRYIEVLLYLYLLLEGLSGVVALTRVMFFLCPFCNTVSNYYHVNKGCCCC